MKYNLKGKRFGNLIVLKEIGKNNVTEWAKITGIKKETLFSRIREGWSVEDMLTKPLQQGKKGT